ncbi:hypothetical protein BJV78DRAFT_1154572 [Lactifluus subvellereus]|nr:hypothetical protein BJV78DRAFT_1154572 [Lactifluus subvellereus]
MKHPQLQPTCTRGPRRVFAPVPLVDREGEGHQRRTILDLLWTNSAANREDAFHGFEINFITPYSTSSGIAWETWRQGFVEDSTYIYPDWALPPPSKNFKQFSLKGTIYGGQHARRTGPDARKMVHKASNAKYRQPKTLGQQALLGGSEMETGQIHTPHARPCYCVWTR